MEDRIPQDTGVVYNFIELAGQVSIAILMILLAGKASATVSKFAIAVPPRFLISSTTSSAGAALLPEPSAATPGSFTTTLAPSAAQRSAISRPMPRPAPVTTTTLSPSDLDDVILFILFILLYSSFVSLTCRASRLAGVECVIGLHEIDRSLRLTRSGSKDAPLPHLTGNAGRYRQGERDYETDEGRGFRAPRILHRCRQIRKVATGEARHQRRKRSIYLSPICDANVAEYPSNPLILLFGGPGRTRTSNQAIMRTRLLRLVWAAR